MGFTIMPWCVPIVSEGVKNFVGRRILDHSWVEGEQSSVLARESLNQSGVLITGFLGRTVRLTGCAFKVLHPLAI